MTEKIKKAIQKITAEQFFEEHNRSFIEFGELFTKKLTDEELVTALAEKDLEKLAKVFKLVFDMLRENGGDDNDEAFQRLMEAYSELDDCGDGDR